MTRSKLVQLTKLSTLAHEHLKVMHKSFCYLSYLWRRQFSGVIADSQMVICLLLIKLNTVILLLSAKPPYNQGILGTNSGGISCTGYNSKQITTQSQSWAERINGRTIIWKKISQVWLKQMTHKQDTTGFTWQVWWMTINSHNCSVSQNIKKTNRRWMLVIVVISAQTNIS